MLLLPLHLCANAASDEVTFPVEVNETNFPDAVFRNYVNEKIAGGDKVLTQDEAEKITTFGNAFNKKGITTLTDLTGLKYFPNLKVLFCQDNPGLTSIDLSNNSALQELNITGCKVTSLDFSNNPNMRRINCADMATLTDINLKGCTGLKFLTVANNNLKKLDVTECSGLTYLSCYKNRLTSIDLSSNTSLDTLICDHNQLSSLNVKPCTKMTYLMCFNNQITSLDVSQNLQLKYLSCYSNKISALDVSHNTQLNILYCFINKLTSLDVSKNTLLTQLSCYNNEISALDVSHNTKLTSLLCFNNNLSKLDLQNNTALVDLSCYGNSLTSLDLSKNNALAHIDCSRNRLTSFIGHPVTPTQLKFFSIKNNALASFDLSGYTALVENYKSGSFASAGVGAQTRSMMLYTDGTDAYMKVEKGINADSISDAAINISGSSSPITLNVGEAADGLVPLKFSNGSVRKRLFAWNNKTASPITITYKYKTGSSLTDMKVMDVTDTVECYLLPMSQEYGTVSLPYDALLPEGATAYAVSATNVKAGSNDNTATLTKIAGAGEVVAAGTPMLIHRDADKYSLFAFNKGTGTAKTAASNLLLGTNANAIDNKPDYYVLGINANTKSPNYGKLGFYRSTSSKVGSWRAYLAITAASAGAARGFLLSLEDFSTGISTVRTSDSDADGLWYNIDGVPSDTKPSQKGIYIHNGRKVFITQ